MKGFQILDLIGVGSYSKVYKAQRIKDKTVYALKLVNLVQLSTQERSNCLNEIRMLAKIRHPNIIQYKEAFEEEGQLGLVMEWAEQGDFMQLMIRRKKQKLTFGEEQVCAYLREMANGLAALHSMKIIHRDVKAENFFIGEGQMVKLGDMNVSSISRNGMASTKMGTPFYTSPQIWMEKSYSTSADIWSLGCLLYQILTFCRPFTGKDVVELKQVVLKGQYQQLPEDCPAQLRELVRNCLSLEPSLRPTASQISNSPYIKQKYRQYKQKTMQKDPMNFRQRNMTCARLLQQISFNNGGLGRSNLPPSQYLSKQTERSRQKRGKTLVTPRGTKKVLNQKMMTVLQIYNQKSLVQQQGTYPPRFRMIR